MQLNAEQIEGIRLFEIEYWKRIERVNAEWEEKKRLKIEERLIKNKKIEGTFCTR